MESHEAQHKELIDARAKVLWLWTECFLICAMFARQWETPNLHTAGGNRATTELHTAVLTLISISIRREN